MSLNYYKNCSLPLVSLFIAANTAVLVSAEDIYDSLPPINNLDEQTLPIRQQNQNKIKAGSREYTFKAPGNKTLTNTGQITSARGYKVEVYGNATELLLQVRDIEPKAFIKGNIIQVGIFSQQNNAENMVRQLTAAGFWSRMVAD